MCLYMEVILVPAGCGGINSSIAHMFFNTPDDQLVWDVGHQAYGHKILTECAGDNSIRNRLYKGFAGFPKEKRKSL